MKEKRTGAVENITIFCGNRRKCCGYITNGSQVFLRLHVSFLNSKESRGVISPSKRVQATSTRTIAFISDGDDTLTVLQQFTLRTHRSGRLMNNRPSRHVLCKRHAKTAVEGSRQQSSLIAQKVEQCRAFRVDGSYMFSPNP